MALENDNVLAGVANAFASYLAKPGPSLAAMLADRLAEADEIDTAEVLIGFLRSGPYRAEVEWWGRDATCWVDLEPPRAEALGELWFDPIELSLAILEPAPRADADFRGWVSVAPIKPWQLQAVHLLTQDEPRSEDFGPVTANGAEVSGFDMHWYVAALGKTEPTAFSWRRLRLGYGADLTRRLWGDPHEQFGGGGRISGTVQVITLEEIETWVDKDQADVWAREVFDMEPLGLPFRSATRLAGAGDWGLVPRSWE